MTTKEVLLLRIKKLPVCNDGNINKPFNNADLKAENLDDLTKTTEIKPSIDNPIEEANSQLSSDIILRFIFRDGTFHLLHNEKISALKGGECLINDEIKIAIQLETLLAQGASSNPDQQAISWKDLVGSDATLLLDQINNGFLSCSGNDLEKILFAEDPLDFLRLGNRTVFENNTTKE